MMSQKYIYPSLFQEEEPQESVPGDKKEYDLTNLFERLAKSDFRSRFHLSKQDREYVMFSWLNMPLAVVAGDASSSGITSQQAGH